ncbi:MAG: hypothetical protein WCY05_07960 [Candidatus Omnitrophota bacterium]
MNKPTIKQTLEEIDNLTNQIEEIEKPIHALESKIVSIKNTIERGKRLKESDYFGYIKQNGDETIRQLEQTLNTDSEVLKSLKEKTENQAKPLLIAISNKEALLAEMRKKSASKKDRERENREQSKTPIDLMRWAKRLRWQRSQKIDPLVWKVIGLANKREKQILDQIMRIYGLKLVPRKELTKHYANKYSCYRLSLWKRGYYLIPDPQYSPDLSNAGKNLSKPFFAKGITQL